MSKRARKWLTWSVAAILLLFVLDQLWDVYAERQAISISLQWARLEPLPKSKRELRVETTGTMFTREFRVHFKAPVSDIQKWIAASPGTAEAAQDRKGHRVHYDIKAGGGAQFAEIIVDEEAGSVEIHTYWS